MTKGLAIDDLPLANCDWRSAIGDWRLAIGYSQVTILVVLLALLPLLPACSRSPTPDPQTDSTLALTGDLAPTALAISSNSQNLYIACAAAKQVLVFNPVHRQITRRLPLPGEPSGLVLSPDGARLFVTCAGHASQVCILDTASGRVLTTLPAGHTALSPVLSATARRSSFATASTTPSCCSTCAGDWRSAASQWHASLYPPA